MVQEAIELKKRWLEGHCIYHSYKRCIVEVRLGSAWALCTKLSGPYDLLP